jgi:hypothetical protein
MSTITFSGTNITIASTARCSKSTPPRRTLFTTTNFCLTANHLCATYQPTRRAGWQPFTRKRKTWCLSYHRTNESTVPRPYKPNQSLLTHARSVPMWFSISSNHEHKPSHRIYFPDCRAYGIAKLPETCLQAGIMPKCQSILVGNTISTRQGSIVYVGLTGHDICLSPDFPH